MGVEEAVWGLDRVTQAVVAEIGSPIWGCKEGVTAEEGEVAADVEVEEGSLKLSDFCVEPVGSAPTSALP